MSNIVTVFNQKGGVGKTTVCGNLAYFLGKSGHNVLLLNIDKQQTMNFWISSGNGFPCEFVDLSDKGDDSAEFVINFLVENKDKYDFIFVDCPPYLYQEGAKGAIAVSDMVITPVTPSPADLSATHTALSVVNDIMTMNPKVLPLICLNMVDKTNISKAVFQSLNEIKGWRTLKNSLSRLTAYKESIFLGVGVIDLPNSSKTKVEVAHLAFEVVEILNERKK